MIELVVAALVTALSVATLLPVLRRLSIVDVPNERSSHARPTPRAGGLAVVLGIGAAALVSTAVASPLSWPLLVVALCLAGVGLLDDLRSLRSGPRLGLQFVAAVVLVLWASSAHGSAGVPGVAFATLGTIGVVGYVNAFNFMDGVNGISALNAAVAGGWFAWLGERHDIVGVVPVALALSGAALGFLPWNAPRARVFLGDVGSYGVGALIAGLALVCWAAGASWLLCVAPLVVYGADTATVLVKRALGRRPLMQAHREHVYQRLVDAGWSHGASAGLTAVLSALMALLAAAWHQSAPVLVAAGYAVLAAAYLAGPSVGRCFRRTRGARV